MPVQESAKERFYVKLKIFDNLQGFVCKTTGLEQTGWQGLSFLYKSL